MSQENVEIVRGFLEAVKRFFEAYWESPRSIVAAVEADDLWPEYRDALSYVHPEVEWQTAFLGETSRGFLEIAKVWDDFLTWAEDYKVDLQEVEDLGGDLVYGVVTLAGTAQGSGTMDARFFDLFTIRNGSITRIEEYTNREQALAAAGLQE